VNALVLAAGAASRFGIPKTLLPAGAGETLLSRVLELALEAVDGDVAVVLGREARLAEYEVKRALGVNPETDRVGLVMNPDYRQGLSGSLKAGLSALSHHEATLVLLADQPALRLDQLEELVNAYRQGDVLAASAAERGEQRPPVVLGPELLPEVLALEGDAGARGVLARHADRVRLLEWGEGLWSADVDGWEDYRRLALALGWHEEATPSLPITRELPPGLLEAARHVTGPAPRLTPEVLLVAYPPVPEPRSRLQVPVPEPRSRLQVPVPEPRSRLRVVDAAFYRLEAGTLGEFRAIAAGSAETPGDYLGLLRRAALSLLRDAVLCSR
jgi:molybdenum cofactor cytidylyltransferase